MDIEINKHLTYKELDDFLKAQVNCSYFIVYDREANDWNNFNHFIFI